MQSDVAIYSLPRLKLVRWLTDAGPDVPHDIRVALVGSLFATLPVFAGGVVNTVVVSGATAFRVQTAPFFIWFALEAAICVLRLLVLIVARRAALKRRRTPTDLYILLGVAWSMSVGYGVLISLASGDWVAATLACLSAAGMVGGICFRNFSAPRYAGAMIITSLGPCLPGAALAAEPLMFIVFAQIPMYLLAMSVTAFKLNRLLIATMRAERENEHRARHDALTGLSNRLGLSAALDASLAAQGDRTLALLFLDLDGFKQVNDTFGHAAGDRLLKIVAERLRGATRASDIAARIGGDEFVLVVEDANAEQAMKLGQKLIAAIGTSYDLDESRRVAVGVSVGIAMAPEHGGDLDSLLSAADAALYEAKSTGKSRCCVASPAAALRLLRQQSAAAVSRIGAAA